MKKCPREKNIHCGGIGDNKVGGVQLLEKLNNYTPNLEGWGGPTPKKMDIVGA